MSLKQEMRSRYVQACHDLLDDEPADGPIRSRARWIVALCVCFVLVCIALVCLGAALASIAYAQPQPLLHKQGMLADFGLLEFDNGSQWYLRESAIKAIHAIPDEQAKRLGHKSVIHVSGVKVNTPYTVTEVLKKLEDSDVARTDQ